MKGKRVISFILSVALVITLVSVNSSTLLVGATGEQTWKTAKELIKEKGFLNGIQMIESYTKTPGNDIGDSGIWKTKENFKPEVWREFFANSKAMGFDICKIWNNYQMGGILFDSDWKVIGPTETYLANLETIFRMAQENNLYMCLTLMTHFESSFGTQSTQYNYDRLVRLIHNKTYRDCFINNWVKPVLELSAQYPNVIMADLYCEPEADGGLWRLTRGTNWDNIRVFISELQAAVEKYNPRLSTYSSSSYAPTEKLRSLYGELGLDYYAFDQYNSTGESLNPYNLFLDRPLIYGEIGPKGLTNKEANVKAFYKAYLDNCITNGIKAAFYWSYHPTQISASSLIDNDGTGRLREAAAVFRKWASDREKTVNGTSSAYDKPAIMYSNSDFLRWFGARNATNYKVQRSEDKSNWTTLLEFNPNTDTGYAFYDMMYEYNDTTMQNGHTYYYRIRAEFSGSSNYTLSDVSYGITKYKETCSAGENLITCGDFNNFNSHLSDNATNGWYVKAPSDASSPIHYQVISDGTAGDNTYSGSSSLYMPNFMYQDVTLKPNTDYTFTFHYKYQNNLGYYHQFFGLLDNFPASHGKFNSNNYYSLGTVMKNPVMPDIKKERNGKWHRYTYRFNSGDVTKVRVIFDSYYSDSSDIANWYLDEVYLFEGWS